MTTFLQRIKITSTRKIVLQVIIYTRFKIARSIGVFRYLKVERYITELLLNWKYTRGNKYELLWVDPKSIKRKSPKGGLKFWGRIDNGNWDKNNKHIKCTKTYHKYTEVLQGKKSWEDINFRHENNDIISRRRNNKDNKVARLSDLEESLLSEGYKSQKKMYKTNKDLAHKNNNDSLHPILNEICVDIARDGELLWRGGGKHRLMFSQILGVNTVCVRVVSRHKNYDKD